MCTALLCRGRYDQVVRGAIDSIRIIYVRVSEFKKQSGHCCGKSLTGDESSTVSIYPLRSALTGTDGVRYVINGISKMHHIRTGFALVLCMVHQ